MNNCKQCSIGIWLDYEDTRLVTYSELKDNIHAMNDAIKCINELVGNELRKTVLFKDYFDRRKNLNFTLFYYCPFCGKPINAKELMHLAQEDDKEKECVDDN